MSAGPSGEAEACAGCGRSEDGALRRCGAFAGLGDSLPGLSLRRATEALTFVLTNPRKAVEVYRRAERRAARRRRARDRARNALVGRATAKAATNAVDCRGRCVL